MRKALFLLACFIQAMSASATTIAGDANPPNPTLTTYYSITQTGDRTLGSGTYHVKGVYSTSPTGPWSSTDTFYTGSANSFTKVFSGLAANTTYYLGFVLYSAAYTDSFPTQVWSETTSQAPQEPVVTITSYIPALPKSMIIFSYTAIGETWWMFGRNAYTQAVMTDSARLIGAGTDTLYITNGANQNIPTGLIHFVPLNGTVPGIYPSNSTNTWPAFNAPGYTHPTITSLTASNILRDSFNVTMSAAVGNAGMVTGRVRVYRTNGTLIQALNPVSFITDSALHYLFTAGTADSTYMVIGSVTNSTGTFYDTVQVTTQPAPIYTPPYSMSFTYSHVLRDSFQIATSVAVGNGTAVTVRMKVQTMQGVLKQQFGAMLILSDSTLNYLFTNGAPDSTYMVIKTLVNNTGTFYDTMYVTTAQIPSPGVTASAGPSTLTSYTVNVSIQTNGTWPASRVDSVYVTDAIGTVAQAVSILGSGSTTVTVNGRSPNTTYTPTVTVVNLANLIGTTSCTDTTLDLVPGFSPVLGSSVVSNDPSSMDITASYTVPSGLGQVLVGVRQDGSNVVDTVPGLINVTGTGAGPITVSNLLGGTKYWFQLLGKSVNGLIGGNGQEKWGITVAPGNPDVKSVVATSLTTTSISGQSTYNGEGVMGQGETQLWKAGIFQQTTGVVSGGTGQFTQNFDFQSLPSGTLFEVRATASESPSGANPIEMSQFYSTVSSTGIEEITADEYFGVIPMYAWDEEGRLLGEGLRSELQDRYKGQIVAIGPQDASLLKRYHAKWYGRS